MDSITQDMLIDIHSKTEIYLPDIYNQILRIRDLVEAIFVIVVVISIFNIIALTILILTEFKKEEQGEEPGEESGYNNKGA